MDEAREKDRRAAIAAILAAADEANRRQGARDIRGFFEALGPMAHDGWDAVERLRQGDATAIEPALRFLEADPMAFRSGYLKERLMRRLKSQPLDPDQISRLRVVLLHLVDAGDRRDFRYACRLASRCADDSFVDALRVRSEGGDAGVARRAGWMLGAMGVARP